MNDKLKEEIRKTLGILKNGGVILYPTDTIWGLGCDATNPEAVKRIYDIKKRADNMFFFHAAERAMEIGTRTVNEIKPENGSAENVL